MDKLRYLFLDRLRYPSQTSVKDGEYLIDKSLLNQYDERKEIINVFPQSFVFCPEARSLDEKLATIDHHIATLSSSPLWSCSSSSSSSSSTATIPEEEIQVWKHPSELGGLLYYQPATKLWTVDNTTWNKRGLLTDNHIENFFDTGGQSLENEEAFSDWLTVIKRENQMKMPHLQQLQEPTPQNVRVLERGSSQVIELNLPSRDGLFCICVSAKSSNYYFDTVNVIMSGSGVLNYDRNFIFPSRVKHTGDILSQSWTNRTIAPDRRNGCNPLLQGFYIGNSISPYSVLSENGTIICHGYNRKSFDTLQFTKPSLCLIDGDGKYLFISLPMAKADTEKTTLCMVGHYVIDYTTRKIKWYIPNDYYKSCKIFNLTQDPLEYTQLNEYRQFMSWVERVKIKDTEEYVEKKRKATRMARDKVEEEEEEEDLYYNENYGTSTSGGGSGGGGGCGGGGGLGGGSMDYEETNPPETVLVIQEPTIESILSTTIPNLPFTSLHAQRKNEIKNLLALLFESDLAQRVYTYHNNIARYDLDVDNNDDGLEGSKGANRYDNFVELYKKRRERMTKNQSKLKPSLLPSLAFSVKSTLPIASGGVLMGNKKCLSLGHSPETEAFGEPPPLNHVFLNPCFDIFPSPQRNQSLGSRPLPVVVVSEEPSKMKAQPTRLLNATFIVVVTDKDASAMDEVCVANAIDQQSHFSRILVYFTRSNQYRYYNGPDPDWEYNKEIENPEQLVSLLKRPTRVPSWMDVKSTRESIPIFNSDGLVLFHHFPTTSSAPPLLKILIDLALKHQSDIILVCGRQLANILTADEMKQLQTSIVEEFVDISKKIRLEKEKIGLHLEQGIQSTNYSNFDAAKDISEWFKTTGGFPLSAVNSNPEAPETPETQEQLMTKILWRMINFLETNSTEKFDFGRFTMKVQEMFVQEMLSTETSHARLSEKAAKNCTKSTLKRLLKFLGERKQRKENSSPQLEQLRQREEALKMLHQHLESVICVRGSYGIRKVDLAKAVKSAVVQSNVELVREMTSDKFDQIFSDEHSSWELSNYETLYVDVDMPEFQRSLQRHILSVKSLPQEINTKRHQYVPSMLNGSYNQNESVSMAELKRIQLRDIRERVNYIQQIGRDWEKATEEATRQGRKEIEFDYTWTQLNDLVVTMLDAGGDFRTNYENKNKIMLMSLVKADKVLGNWNELQKFDFYCPEEGGLLDIMRILFRRTIYNALLDVNSTLTKQYDIDGPGHPFVGHKTIDFLLQILKEIPIKRMEQIKRMEHVEGNNDRVSSEEGWFEVEEEAETNDYYSGAESQSTTLSRCARTCALLALSIMGSGSEVYLSATPDLLFSRNYGGRKRRSLCDYEYAAVILENWFKLSCLLPNERDTTAELSERFAQKMIKRLGYMSTDILKKVREKEAAEVRETMEEETMEEESMEEEISGLKTPVKNKRKRKVGGAAAANQGTGKKIKADWDKIETAILETLTTRPEVGQILIHPRNEEELQAQLQNTNIQVQNMTVEEAQRYFEYFKMVYPPRGLDDANDDKKDDDDDDAKMSKRIPRLSWITEFYKQHKLRDIVLHLREIWQPIHDLYPLTDKEKYDGKLIKKNRCFVPAQKSSFFLLDYIKDIEETEDIKWGEFFDFGIDHTNPRMEKLLRLLDVLYFQCVAYYLKHFNPFKTVMILLNDAIENMKQPKPEQARMLKKVMGVLVKNVLLFPMRDMTSEKGDIKTNLLFTRLPVKDISMLLGGKKKFKDQKPIIQRMISANRRLDQSIINTTELRKLQKDEKKRHARVLQLQREKKLRDYQTCLQNDVEFAYIVYILKRIYWLRKNKSNAEMLPSNYDRDLTFEIFGSPDA